MGSYGFSSPSIKHPRGKGLNDRKFLEGLDVFISCHFFIPVMFPNMDDSFPQLLFLHLTSCWISTSPLVGWDHCSLDIPCSSSHGGNPLSLCWLCQSTVAAFAKLRTQTAVNQLTLCLDLICNDKLFPPLGMMLGQIPSSTKSFMIKYPSYPEKW